MAPSEYALGWHGAVGPAWSRATAPSTIDARLRAVRANRSFSRCGRRATSCSSCPIAPVGGICIARMAIGQSLRWPRSSANRSGPSAHPRTRSSTRASLRRAYTEHGRWKLGVVDTQDAHPASTIDDALEPTDSVRARGDTIYFIGGSPTESPAIVRVDCDDNRADVLRSHQRSHRSAMDLGAGGDHSLRRNRGTCTRSSTQPKNPDFTRRHEDNASASRAESRWPDGRYQPTCLMAAFSSGPVAASL